MALTMIQSMDDFENDPLISELYAGREDRVDIWADIRRGRIIERPKVVYNDKTKSTSCGLTWMETRIPTTIVPITEKHRLVMPLAIRQRGRSFTRRATGWTELRKGEGLLSKRSGHGT